MLVLELWVFGNKLIFLIDQAKSDSFRYLVFANQSFRDPVDYYRFNVSLTFGFFKTTINRVPVP